MALTEVIRRMNEAREKAGRLWPDPEVPTARPGASAYCGKPAVPTK
jgi:hypothetical protein